jgi:hypothetical protein
VCISSKFEKIIFKANTKAGIKKTYNQTMLVKNNEKNTNINKTIDLLYFLEKNDFFINISHTNKRG